MFVCYFSLSVCIRQLMKFPVGHVYIANVGQNIFASLSSDFEYVYFPVKICISKSLFANIF